VSSLPLSDPLRKAIESFLSARNLFIETNASSRSGQVMSWTVIDIAKLDIADALLVDLGHPDNATIEDLARRQTEIGNERLANTRSVPRWLRSTILERDGNRCVKCGSTIDLQIDHIIPFSRGGKTCVTNLETLCRDCNRTKRDKMP